MKRFLNTLALNEAALTADADSGAIDFSYLESWAAHIIWTSTTAAGTVKIQHSNDGTNWLDIASASQAIANNSGAVMLSGVDFAPQYLRVFCDFTSGSITTLTVRLTGKGR